MLNTFKLSIDVSLTTIQKLVYKLSLNANKIKIATMISFIGVIPMGVADVGHKQYDTKIQLAQNPAEILTFDNTVQVTRGKSNLDANKIAKSTGQLASANYGRAIERDGTYFQGIYKAAGAQYGVPWKLLQAVHYVETGCSDSGIKSSYAGAQGPMQFMAGTWRAYGVDGDGNGTADINNVNDAIYGGANYLAANGAASGDINGALLHYNHSQSYVNKVMEVYNSIQG